MDVRLIILGISTFSGLSLSDQCSNSTCSNVTTATPQFANNETTGGLLTTPEVGITNLTTISLNRTFSAPYNASTPPLINTTYEPSISTPLVTTSAFSSNSSDVTDSPVSGFTKGLTGALGRLLLGLLQRRFSWAELLAAVFCSVFVLAVCTHVAILVHYGLRQRRKGVLRVGMATTSSPPHSDGGFESFDAPTLQVRYFDQLCINPSIIINQNL